MSTEQLDLVWREIDRIETCMMVTHDAGTIRARPMVGRADRPAKTIWFISNRTRHKDDEVAADPSVCLTYADVARNTYLSISGKAMLSDDRAKLRELWSTGVDAWFKDGPDDPDAILIAVRPESAEYWDNPNSDLLVAVRTLTASGTDQPAQVGENRKIEM